MCLMCKFSHNVLVSNLELQLCSHLFLNSVQYFFVLVISVNLTIVIVYHLLQVYGRVYRVVEPKRQRLNAATQQLKEKQFQLQEAKDKLAEVSNSTCNNSQGVII